jgi:PAS domain S-box-containing protein
MEKKRVERLVSAGEKGELVGISTENMVLESLEPSEVYNIIHCLEAKIKQLEAEKIKLLENHNLELKTIVEAKTFELAQKGEQEQLVNKIALKIRNSLDLEVILETAVKEIKEFLLVDQALIYQFNSDLGGKIVAESVDQGWSKTLKESIKDECFHHSLNDFYLQNCDFIANNIEEADLSKCHKNLFRSVEVKANVVVPIIVTDIQALSSLLVTDNSPPSDSINYLWGILIVHQCANSRNWREDEINFLQQLAAQMAIAIQQAQILTKAKQEIEQRKQKEKLLEEAERLAHLGSWNLDLETNFLWWSDEVYRIFELDPQQFAPSYQAFLNQIYPEDRELVDHTYRQSIEDKTCYNILHRLQMADGKIKYVREIGQTEYDDTGKPLRSTGTVQDLTELHLKELALREKQAHLEEAQQIAHLGSWDFYLKTNKITWSDEVFRIFGLEPHDREITYETLTEYIAPEEHPRRQQFVNRAIQFGEPFETELRIIRADGSEGYIFTKGKSLVNDQGEVIRLTGIVMDISDRHHKEALIQQQLQDLTTWQNRYETASRASGQIFYESDWIKNKINWSANTEKILNLVLEEMPNNISEYLNLIHPEDISRVLIYWEMSLAKKMPTHIKYRVRKKEGSYIWVEDCSEFVLDSQNEVVGFIGRIADIDQSWQAEQLLRESEIRFRQLADNIRQVFYLTDIKTNQILYINPSYETIWLRSCQELLADPQSYLENIYPEDREIAIRAYQSQRLGESTEEQYRIIRPDGSLRWILDRTFPVKDEFGEVYRVCGIAEDITERQQIELDLKTMNDRFNKISSSSPAVIYIMVLRPDGSIYFEYLSSAVESITELSLEQVLANAALFFNQIHPDDWPSYLKLVKQSAKACQNFHYKWRFITPSGKLKWIEATSQPEKRTNGDIAWYGVASDITHQTEAELELKQLQERLALVLKGSNDGWWDWDIVNDQLYLSPRWWSMLGYTTGELENSHQVWQNLIHPEDVDQVNRVLHQSLFNPDQEISEVEYRLRHKDGHYVPVLARGYTLRNDLGQPVRNSGTNTDLTLLKQKEYSLEQALNALQELNQNLEIVVAERTKALRESEQRWQLALQGTNDGIWDWNILTGEVFYSPRWKAMLGYSEAEIAPDIHQWEKLVYPDDFPLAQKALEDNFQGKTEFYTLEHRLLSKDGSYKWILTRGKVVCNPQGEPIRMVGSHTDISDRKLAEAKLQQSEHRFRRIFESNVVGMMFTTHGGLVTDANDRFLDLVGYTRNELNNKEINWAMMTPPEYHQADQEAIEHLKLYGAIDPWEKEYYRRDGSRIAILIGVAKLSEPEDSFVCVVVDITDRQQAEQALKLSEERFRRYFEQSLLGMAITSPNQDWLDTNERLSEILGYSHHELVQMNWAEITHPADLATDTAYFNRVLSGEIDGYQIDKRFIHKQGHVIYAQISVKCLRKNDGFIDLFFFMIQDISDRHCAEECLKESEARYRRIVETANEGIWVIDKNAKTTFANQKMADLLKLSVDQLIGKPLFDFLTQSGKPEVEQILARRQQHIEEKTENCLKCADGSEIWVLASNTPIFDQSGHYAGALAMVTDISDRRYAEQELLKLSTRLEIAIRSANIGIWEWDIQSNNLVWDQRMYQLYDVNPFVSPTLSTWSSKLHPDHVDSTERAIQQALAGLDHYEDEFKIILSDGSFRYIKAFALVKRDAKNQPERMIGVNYDITHLKQAEQNVQESEERYRSLMEKASDAILLADLQGNLIDANQKAIELFGYSKEEITQMTMRQLHEEGELDKYVAVFRDIADQGVGKLLDAQIFCKNGTFVDVDITGSLIQWGEKPILQGIFRDITERKQAENKLRESYEKLAQTNADLARATRLKDEFLANMSHELRTPLNAILGMSEALLDQAFGLLNDQQRRSLQTVTRSGNHLLSLINDILDLSKIEAGKITLTYSSISIHQLCDSSISFIKQQAAQKQIQLEVDIPPNLPPLFLDERRIRQVLINLLNNAVKFTNPQGKITLKVTLEPSTETGNMIRCAVIDTGIGITPENISKLFQPFVQIDSALNRQYTGTGLGLSLVKRLVEMHDGRVSVTSQPGVGSCFMIDLPCPDLSLSSPLSFSPQPPQPTSDFKLDHPSRLPLILLAEDNEANVCTISSYLSAKGFRILVANNGQEAIDLTLSQSPDLILMDIQMPHVDGLVAIKTIRQYPQFASIPIIALTALAMPGDRDQCLQAGANEYITKPIRLKHLVTTILQFLA